jgi:hypothetical protein
MPKGVETVEMAYPRKLWYYYYYRNCMDRRHMMCSCALVDSLEASHAWAESIMKPMPEEKAQDMFLRN